MLCCPNRSRLVVRRLRGGRAGTFLTRMLRQRGLQAFKRYSLAFWTMAGAPGLEPGTLCLEGRCSIQLSYAPAVFSS